MPPALQTFELSRRFGDHRAVDGLSIDADPGEVLALLGPNGAGKTTTVRLLNGVLTPDHGRVTVLGMDPARQGDELRARTGVLTENAGVDERFTALENLLFVARLRGMDVDDARARAMALLERFGLADRADDKVQGFSTGQRKRVALARSLLHDPEVLFLDEPTSGLDPSATRDVLALIESLATERGRTVLLCTHFLGEASKLANRVAVLHQGRLQAFGTQADIASSLWSGLDTLIDLGQAAPPDALDALRALPGVRMAVPSGNGARVAVDRREVVPTLVATLVGLGLPVFEATPQEPTLEDIYFAIASKVADDEVATHELVQ